MRNRSNYTKSNLNRREAYLYRTSIVRREKIVIAFIFSMALLFSIFFFSLKVNAGNFKEETDSIKMYKSITIYLGDSFESIAEEYMSDEFSSEIKYIDEVLSINGMTRASKLVPGNKIIIPYYVSESIETNQVIEFSLAK
ncbi:MAG: hypothetical protein Q4D29_12590 [Lachnospiraceae bacterium]|nr:hypothetical protein [Lachnospiraceae bacterium]